jgi:hypothetical protein
MPSDAVLCSMLSLPGRSGTGPSFAMTKQQAALSPQGGFLIQQSLFASQGCGYKPHGPDGFRAVFADRNEPQRQLNRTALPRFEAPPDSKALGFPSDGMTCHI